MIKVKKYFKIGLATIIPILFVFFVIKWAYNTFDNIMVSILPGAWGYEWWYVFVFVIAMAILILLIGMVFSLIKPMQWLKRMFDKIMGKVPVVKTIYSFGLEITDALIADGKLDGNIKVVDVEYGGHMTKGLLTNQEKNHVFIATAPNPMNGFVFITKEYVITNETIEEYLKFLTSLGKL